MADPFDPSVIQSRHALRLAHWNRLVDSWLGPDPNANPKTEKESNIQHQNQPQNKDSSELDDLAALRRSQRAGLGASQGSSGAGRDGNGRSRDARGKDAGRRGGPGEDDDQRTLRRQLRVGRAPTRKNAERVGRGERRREGSEGSESDEGRSEAVGARRRGTRVNGSDDGENPKPPEATDGEVTHATQNGGGAEVEPTASTPSQKSAKRKQASFLDEILQERQAKKSKTKKKKQKTHSTSLNDDEVPQPDQSKPKRPNTQAAEPTDDQSSKLSQRKPKLGVESSISSRPAPVEVPDRNGSSKKPPHSDEALGLEADGDDAPETPGVQESEAEKRRRKNKEKKMKFKQKQQQRKAGELPNG